MKRQYALTLVICLAILLGSAGASANHVVFDAVYDSVRTYRNGHNVFVVDISPDETFEGTVWLHADADPGLNIQIDHAILDNKNRVAEIVVSPDTSLSEFTDYPIRLTAVHKVGMFTHETHELTLTVKVDMDWQVAKPQPPEFVLSYLDAFHPEFGIHDGTPFDTAYATYGGLLIVEHNAYLNDEWELRYTYHVASPQPYDWDRVCLRKRGATKWLFAIMREHTAAPVQQISPEECVSSNYGY